MNREVHVLDLGAPGGENPQAARLQNPLENTRRDGSIAPLSRHSPLRVTSRPFWDKPRLGLITYIRSEAKGERVQMSWSAFRTFTDPDAYHAAFRDTRTASVIIGRGGFRADL